MPKNRQVSLLAASPPPSHSCSAYTKQVAFYLLCKRQTRHGPTCHFFSPNNFDISAYKDNLTSSAVLNNRLTKLKRRRKVGLILFNALLVFLFLFFILLILLLKALTSHFNKPGNLSVPCITQSVGKGTLFAPTNTSLKHKEREKTKFNFCRRGCTTRRMNRRHMLLVCFRGYACL